jgi:hypothetical protein
LSNLERDWFCLLSLIFVTEKESPFGVFASGISDVEIEVNSFIRIIVAVMVVMIRVDTSIAK